MSNVKSVNTKEINAYIAEAIEAGKTTDDIKVGLITEKALSFNAAAKCYSAYLKENNLSVKRVSFSDGYHAFLKTGVKSVEEVEAYIKENGSNNTWNHRGYYLGEASLANHFHELMAKKK
jgi:hypothetical protein